MPGFKETHDTAQENTKDKKSDERVILYAHGKTYDVTDFVNKHPAGSRCILSKKGKDCTIDYDFHSSRARKLWKEYKVDPNKSDSQCVVM
ncbi:cytochrome b-like heme/steroid binding domain containing protein [Yasminevirus sp. GU-2018]|uniref:Cytochrome b-like heme/steroid binding domain containing protein n=1 Tax=Yasminevirus sp. GU-2018 TaxID=2420051 RepID=A0A5K0U750_9VIRU|nr:cytochrome b-like heme/steroid binding domain containing protein [Yasminevirus sp. GU-2018]